MLVVDSMESGGAKSNLLSHLLRLFGTMEDAVFLYYTGHGKRGESTDKKSGAWVICTERQRYLDMHDDGVNDPEDIITLQDILSAWSGRAKRRCGLTIISDACYVPKMQ